MDIIDMHCDTIFECYQQNYGLRKNQGHIDLEAMKSNGALAQFFAIFLPSGKTAEDEHITLQPYELFGEIYRKYQMEMGLNGDMIAPAYSYEDVMKNKKEGKISSILTIEDGALLEGRMDRLYEVYQKGVRCITLTWNYENCIGYPNSLDAGIHRKGLKPFGIEVVKEMNQLGMLVDVSHLSEGGFYDVAKYSKKPFIASHSCAQKLCGHQRNLTDDQMRTLAELGGIAGVNFNSAFLRSSAEYSTIDDIVKHVVYMVNLMGSDCVALGSDFDGIDCGLELAGYEEYGKLISALQTKYSDDIVEKICSENVLRILKECI